MKLRKIILLAVLMLFSVSAFAEQGAGIEGVYERMNDAEFVFNGSQVEVMEFLSFYCGHCYHFEKAIPVIKGNFPKKIKWTTVPIYWGKGSPKPGEAYFLAEEAGKGEEMKRALFQAVFVDKKDIGDLDVLDDIGMKLGLGFDFSRRLRAGDKTKEVGEAILKSTAYKIEETPSLVIASNLKTSPGMFNGNTDLLRENVIIMLKSILRSSR
ncbi:MAG: DsbA family protein [Nitrospirota bacterium]